MCSSLQQQSFKVSEKRGCGEWGADDFLISASSGKPCSEISLTLSWLPVAREKPIIYLLTLLKVCKQSPAARQKAHYGSSAITQSPKGQADQRAWLCGHWGRGSWGKECCPLHGEPGSLRQVCPSPLTTPGICVPLIPVAESAGLQVVFPEIQVPNCSLSA